MTPGPRHPHISSSPWDTAWPLLSWEPPSLFLSDISLNLYPLSTFFLVLPRLRQLCPRGQGIRMPLPLSGLQTLFIPFSQTTKMLGCPPSCNNSNTTSCKRGKLITHSSFPSFTIKVELAVQCLLWCPSLWFSLHHHAVTSVPQHGAETALGNTSQTSLDS